MEVPYEEPSEINDNRKIKLVFFKESLTTGWDCPRAETMMSFRRAKDATYIAQLLGRMVRTPMQQRIMVDESLNNVHLFLPYFDQNTVEQIVNALQSTEGGEIPTDIYGETLGEGKFETWSARPTGGSKKKEIPQVDGQLVMTDLPEGSTPSVIPSINSDVYTLNPNHGSVREGEQIQVFNKSDFGQSSGPEIPAPNKNVEPVVFDIDGDDLAVLNQALTSLEGQGVVEKDAQSSIDREAIIKFINDACLLTYHVRQTRISDYLSSLFKLTRLLVQSGIDKEAKDKIIDEMVALIRDYVQNLHDQGKYEDLAIKAKEFKLSMQVFDVFGKSVHDAHIEQSFISTNADIERQFRQAELKLGGEGLGKAYGKVYFDAFDPDAFQIDVILYAANLDKMIQLQNYAKSKFHELNDQYRRYTVKVDEASRIQYKRIVSDGDQVSKHNFRLPDRIQVPFASEGENYDDHLFVNDEGYAKIKLNDWEAGVLKEEQTREDYVTWMRNPPRKTWALCIPYEMNGEWKSAYPDFLIIRKDEKLGYIVDVLEPHSPDFADNLGKAKGFAEYARQNPGVGRIELIRMDKDAAGNKRFKRLDMSRSAVRDKVLKAVTNDEINHIFDTDGVF